jgi:hypothetical protein
MRKYYNPSLSTITVCFIIAWIITELLSYISNKGISFILYTSLGWAFAYVLAITFSKTIEFVSLFVLNAQKLSYAILVFPLASTTFILSEISTNSSLQWLLLSKDFIKILFTIEICLIIAFIIQLCSFFYSKEYIKALANLTQSTIDISSSSSNKILIEPELLLGQGTSIIDRIIRSLFYRANRSEKAAKISLIIIVFLVFTGGSISIGTIALDQFSKLRQLEKVRQDMLSIINRIDTTTTFVMTDKTSYSTTYVFRKDSTMAKSIKETIETTFGTLEDTKNYKELLENIQKKESYNLSEIIMRVAIAALTFFLVQVFLRIYKYNKQQNTSLLTKAEVLELFNEPGTDMKKLREILASKIEENPRFGSTPTTPIEQIINIADKAKSNGAGS